MQANNRTDWYSPNNKKKNIQDLDVKRDRFCEEAIENIVKIQAENRKSFNKKKIAKISYSPGVLVVIKRTQLSSGLKLRTKFLGPYKVIEKFKNGRHSVEKARYIEEPRRS